MSHEGVDETCACGARFVWSGDSSHAEGRVSAFREEHQHTQVVDDDDPFPLVPDATAACANAWQECCDWMAVQGQADVKGWLLEAAEQANPYAEKP